MKKTTNYKQLPPHLYSQFIKATNKIDGPIIKKKIVYIVQKDNNPVSD
jgi:hypothetical protein